MEAAKWQWLEPLHYHDWLPCVKRCKAPDIRHWVGFGKLFRAEMEGNGRRFPQHGEVLKCMGKYGSHVSVSVSILD